MNPKLLERKKLVNIYFLVFLIIFFACFLSTVYITVGLHVISNFIPFFILIFRSSLKFYLIVIDFPRVLCLDMPPMKPKNACL